jgi:hypothetical protein
MSSVVPRLDLPLMAFVCDHADPVGENDLTAAPARQHLADCNHSRRSAIRGKDLVPCVDLFHGFPALWSRHRRIQSERLPLQPSNQISGERNPLQS